MWHPKHVAESTSQSGLSPIRIGREVLKSVRRKTRREAMDKVNEMSRRIDAGEFKPAQYTFGDTFIRWLEYKPVKEITKVTYRQIVNRQLGQFLEVPVQTMATMAAEVQDAIFDDYANTHLRHIVKGIFDLAMAEGRISGHRLGMLQVEFRPDLSGN